MGGQQITSDRVTERLWYSNNHRLECAGLIANHVVLALLEEGVQDHAEGANLILKLSTATHAPRAA